MNIAPENAIPEPRIIVYHDDNLKVLRSLPEGIIDLIYIDSP